ncbi:MAG: molybdopterin-dependent oxidoreductase [Verrucomicrobia bacterium]|nr:molybdopterin-dependent oxidoreductase [Verrucomicrobiota bacterium]
MPGSSTSPPATPPTAEYLKVVVNGRAVVVPRTMPHPVSGKPLPTTMIQACEIAGVTVPHYCYHPRLPVAGNCRMCLVEYGTPVLGPDRKPVANADGTPKIVKAPRPAIACATPVSAGMEIYTDTPAVREMRRSVLEFLLINHPLDCPVCDQAGECQLQEYALDYGPAASRFVETKVHKPKQVDLGPRVMLDDERCILCGRCIRFTRDIVGDDALGIIQRGSHSVLAAYPGKPFDNHYTLNTVDLCPVGALTSKDFRFQMRVWFLKETNSLCTTCGTGCNLRIDSRENRIYRLVPRDNPAVNRGWMCDRGRLNFRWINRPDRLARVTRRPAAAAAAGPIPWSDALDDVARRLQQAPHGSVAIIASARQTNEELFLLKRLATRLDAITDALPRPQPADHLLVCDDQNPNSTGARLIGICFTEMGINLPRIADGIRQGAIRTLIVFGDDVLRAKPEAPFTEDIPARDFDAGLLAGLDCLVVSDVLPNATTALAHVLLPGCAPAEKAGSMTNVHGRVQRFHKAVEPPGEARPEWEFLGELVGRVAGEPVPKTVGGLFEQMAGGVPAFAGLTWEGLGDAGVTVSV